MASLRVWIGVIGAASALGMGACGQASDKSPPIDSVACEDAGPKCGTGANTTTNPKPEAGTGADAAADADAGAVETTSLNVRVRVLDSTFSNQFATDYNGSGVVGVPTPTGQQDVALEVDAGTSGTSVGKVTRGYGWFQVRPTGNPDLFTTHSLLRVASLDPLDSFPVPVIDRVSLGAVYTSTSLGAPIDPNAAQIIVLFDGDNSSATGVRVTDSPFLADAVLYDLGPGEYTVGTAVTRTGTAGIVIFANVTSGLGSFSYEFQGKVQTSPPITWVIGQATVAHVPLPLP